MQKTDAKIPETRVSYGYEVAVPYLKLLEKRLLATGGKFFHGDAPGYADLWCKFDICLYLINFRNSL